MMLCVVLVGCAGLEPKQKDYSSHGFNIKMDEGMTEKDLANATATFVGTKTVVTALKEEFELLSAINLDENSSVEEYAKAVITNNKANYELKEKDGIHYFEYEKTNNGKNYYYMAVMYKSDDAFWLVNFACETSNKSTYQDTFLEWAKTVTFDK